MNSYIWFVYILRNIRLWVWKSEKMSISLSEKVISVNKQVPEDEMILSI